MKIEANKNVKYRAIQMKDAFGSDVICYDDNFTVTDVNQFVEKLNNGTLQENKFFFGPKEDCYRFAPKNAWVIWRLEPNKQRYR